MAARLAFLRQLDPFNPLMDFSVIGSADWQMACCLVRKIEKAAHGQVSDAYKRRVEAFFKKCEMYAARDLSYVSGLLAHEWHGKKADRKYTSRWQMLLDHNFDPDTDIGYRSDGLILFTGHNPRLALALRDHHRGKNEDSIDTG